MRRAHAIIVLLAGTAWISAAAVALAAHPRDGARYSGSSGRCAPSIAKQCVFVFGVSRDGQTLEYVKHGTAIAAWTCPNGGGEAVFGTGRYDYRIPPARIRPNGSFSGTGTGTYGAIISGRFTGSGRTAVVRFATKSGCHTGQFGIKQS